MRSSLLSLLLWSICGSRRFDLVGVSLRCASLFHVEVQSFWLHVMASSTLSQEDSELAQVDRATLNIMITQTPPVRQFSRDEAQEHDPFCGRAHQEDHARR
jgi:hypothetical protein